MDITVLFTGGEPTLVKDLIDLLKIKNLGYKKIGIQSNGIKLVNMEYTKTLVDSGLNSLQSFQVRSQIGRNFK